MNWAFQYTPLIWPMLASSIFMWALSLYCWRHRSSPGALALTWSCALASLWAIGNACQLASADPAM